MTVAKAESHEVWPIAFVAGNAIGAFSYVLVASRAWVMPGECAVGINSITGEPFVWFVSIAPVIALFFITDLVWGATILRHRQWKAGRLWLASMAIWLIAVTIDFSHHSC